MTESALDRPATRVAASAEYFTKRKRYTRGQRRAMKAQVVAGRAAVTESAPSPEQVEAARTPAGGWTRDTLAGWGVPWPPPKGWRDGLRRFYEAQQMMGKLG